MNHSVEIKITATEQGVLIQKRKTGKHPVQRVYGILGSSGSTDDYIGDTRGR